MRQIAKNTPILAENTDLSDSWGTTKSINAVITHLLCVLGKAGMWSLEHLVEERFPRRVSCQELRREEAEEADELGTRSTKCVSSASLAVQGRANT